MSEQYVKLEEERRHQQRLEKGRKQRRRKGKETEKEKRGGRARRHGSLPTESDEDIAPAQQVDIITEEMPEVSPGQMWPRRPHVTSRGTRELCIARPWGHGADHSRQPCLGQEMGRGRCQDPQHC